MFIRRATVSALAVAASATAILSSPGINGVVDTKLYDDMLDAVRVMQDGYFEAGAGTWPSAIDWTRAVMGTCIVGAMQSLSDGFEILREHEGHDFKATENLISLYFSHIVGFYFGQDVLSLYHQAHDDMLWVVLGWLDAIKFAKRHSKTHHEDPSQHFPGQSWYGTTWASSFAHRARIFWHKAAAGWDTELCGGGMNWDPKKTPYKNAITNELYISASAAMYLHFPGDNSDSPFIIQTRGPPDSDSGTTWPPHDTKYRIAAVDAHKWLRESQMINDKGLYTDGFHISKWQKGANNTGKKCDARDEMVYTYNQGVILSGLRDLFSMTDEAKYLEEGHRLIRDVILATGWDRETDAPFQDLTKLTGRGLPKWYGLGRAGVLEDLCDAVGDCRQDVQTFKGIWMHHFTAFCTPLGLKQGQATSSRFDDQHATWLEKRHTTACKEYASWLRHNANAALGTRRDGKFGMWWTPGLLRHLDRADLIIKPKDAPLPDGAVDYRNHGVPNEPLWVLVPTSPHPDDGTQKPIMHQRDARPLDVNDRGRGRTVETQGGGLAVLRALWENSRLP